MPIILTPFPSSDCELTEWSIEGARYDEFIRVLAYLYLRQERNALRVISELDPVRRPRHGNVCENALAKLSGPDLADLDLLKSGAGPVKKKAMDRIKNHIAQRDGLLFQHISWIAARIALPNGHMTAPHVRKADKGFDGFIIEVDIAEKKIARLILCEDKASEKPRNLIYRSVWDEIRGIINRERDDQILADLTTLLGGINGLDCDAAEAAIDRMIWDDVRKFRVSVATGENHRKIKGGYAHIMKGFAGVAPGVADSRIGGVLAFKDVRGGLDQISKDVADRVRMISEEIKSV
ncbi:hypothetical protein [Celeribacter indicus]|uniref:hypothetical protein n=1 Tax=Celeribacter indicus TaxID=1208324 RepID=UPI00089A0976|nr:hypothetical protein [Celeribacter indicus]SDX54691.1 hypothetical protein SAMN05443573_1408 [Celeribacter indicus]